MELKFKQTQQFLSIYQNQQFLGIYQNSKNIALINSLRTAWPT